MSLAAEVIEPSYLQNADADRRTAVNCCCYTPMDREVIPPTRPYPKERLVTYVSEVDDYDDELPPSELSVISCILGAICCPFTLMCSCFTVKEKQEAVLLRWGKFERQVSDPGCHWSNCWGREIRMISTAKQTIELPVTKIIDLHGNPLNVSAIVTYYFKNSRKTALNVINPVNFVRDQAQAVMKQVVSRYPYETHDGSPSLKSESIAVGKEMVELLQDKVNVAGARIISFDLNELAYAPEIVAAAGMLRRQQAKALVDARKTIVEGAVEIASEALSSLEKKSIKLDERDKTKLVTNLLTVICADKDAQPTVPL